jgi:asparagine synthase (glutamine-hydrolysing)
VTVALSGDAGDELFGGYNRYFWGPRVWNKTAWLPYPLRRALGGAVRALPPRGWDALSSLAGVNRLGDKAHKVGQALASSRTLDDLYWSLVTEWPAGQGLVRGLSAGEEAAGALAAGALPRDGFGDGLVGRQMSEPPEGLQDATARMMYRDALTYLPDDILCKVDRAAMACSLETRVPFLDHRVVELAWRLPMHMKVRGNVGKWALRQVLYKHVPRELIERPKAGFGIPVGVWLRGPLREWAEDLLNEQRLRDEGFLNPQPIRQAWAQHLSGRHDWTARLWTVLMFQAWRERWA